MKKTFMMILIALALPLTGCGSQQNGANIMETGMKRANYTFDPSGKIILSKLGAKV